METDIKEQMLVDAQRAKKASSVRAYLFKKLEYTLTRGVFDFSSIHYFGTRFLWSIIKGERARSEQLPEISEKAARKRRRQEFDFER